LPYLASRFFLSFYFMKILQRIPPFLKSKYFLTGTFFLVWLAFFDRYDFITQYRMYAELQDLKAERKYYLNEIARNDKDLNGLLNDTESLEKLAREKYLMRNPGEDVYIIIDKTKPGWENNLGELKE
jgi:cell division protein DivIC